MGNENKNIHLHIDLDGTLLKSDLLHEHLIRLLLRNPLKFIAILPSLLKGKLAFKQAVANACDFRNIVLPYNEDLTTWLKTNYLKYKSTNLITASPQKWADLVSDKFPFLNSAHGSKAKNLSGKNKLQFIESEFPGDFIYAGNSSTDLPIWEKANGAIVVGSNSIKNSCEKVTSIIQHFKVTKSFKIFPKALRIHQWAKNLLLFVPLLLSWQDWGNKEAWINVATAFLSFSLVASSVYLLNDLVDLDNDRKHSRKKMRPFASGDLNILLGAGLVPLTFLSGIFLSLMVSKGFLLVLLTYYFITTCYSFALKRLVLVDVLTLSCLYSIRIFAGGVASDVPISHWLLAFSTFFFLSLGFVKRYTEIREKSLEKGTLKPVSGRGYSTEDLNVILGIGLGSGVTSILIYILYINDPHITEKVSSPLNLYAASLVLFYWLMRVWILASRGQMHDDPVVFAIKDKASWIAFLLIGVIYALSLGKIKMIGMM